MNVKYKEFINNKDLYIKAIEELQLPEHIISSINNIKYKKKEEKKSFNEDLYLEDECDKLSKQASNDGIIKKSMVKLLNTCPDKYLEDIVINNINNHSFFD